MAIRKNLLHFPEKAINMILARAHCSLSIICIGAEEAAQVGRMRKENR